MQSKKIKLLVVPSDLVGVGNWRSIWPAQALSKLYPDDFDIEINHQPNVDNIDYLKQFDIIHFHRQLGPYESSDKLFPKLKELSIITICDIDDYWEPPTTHPLYEVVRHEGITLKIINNIKHADYITTTTDIFANHIKQFNKNVFVISNAVDMEQKQWASPNEEMTTDRVRVAWIGGSSHLHDLKLMEPSMTLLHADQNLKDKFQMTLCGFDIRGNITEIRKEIDEKGNIQESRNTRNIKPEETIWLTQFEKIMTSNYRWKPQYEEYFKYLHKISKDDFSVDAKVMDSLPYRRFWTLPLTQYANHYNHADICLAPLQNEEMYQTEKGQMLRRPHYFNDVKSELKLVEAGLKKKVLIAQDFGVYSELIKDGENGILIKNSDNQRGWYNAIKKLISNPELREKMAQNLHDFIIERYEIKVVTATRSQFYKDIFELKHKEIKIEEPAEQNV